MSTHTLSAFIDHQRVSELLPAWLTQLKHQARKTLETLDLPTRKTENWRYSARHLKALNAFGETDRALMKDNLESPSDGHLKHDGIHSELDIPVFGNARIVVRNGVYDAEHSSDKLPNGVTLKRLNELNTPETDENSWLAKLIQTGQDAPFSMLNLAGMKDGVVLDVADNANIHDTIEICFLQDGPSTASRRSDNLFLLRCGKNSSISVIEHHSSTSSSEFFATSRSLVALEESARLNYERISSETESSAHVAQLNITQARASVLSAHHVSFGSKLQRLDIGIQLIGERAHSEINGIYLTKDERHSDTQLTVEHRVPHCESEENFRGVIDDNSHAVFNGKIHIYRDAQKSLANLSNKNLLLSNRAEVNTKPELEIYADDVRCSHGATVGELDHDAVFYLQSRGINREAARAMLGISFINTLIERLPSVVLQDYVHDRLIDFFARNDGET